jgi:hypothetical protein
MIKMSMGQQNGLYLIVLVLNHFQQKGRIGCRIHNYRISGFGIDDGVAIGSQIAQFIGYNDYVLHSCYPPYVL